MIPLPPNPLFSSAATVERWHRLFADASTELVGKFNDFHAANTALYDRIKSKAAEARTTGRNKLYAVMHDARRLVNRACRFNVKKNKWGYGPIRMAVRKQLFARIMDIQRRAGIVLITPEDDRFIKQCWRKKVYPRGWSEEDEATVEPELELIQLFIKGHQPC